MGEVRLVPDLDTFLAVRRAEWETYSAGDDDLEQRGHFLKY